MNNDTPLIDLIEQLPESRVNTQAYRTISNQIVIQIVNFVQANPNNVNERDNDLNTPLHWAVFRHHQNTMRLLLHNGADVNARNVRGDTPLHWAVFPPGYLAGVNTLLEFNADNTIMNSQDATPLAIADNIAETVEDIDFEEYEDIMNALEEHVVRPTPGRIQEYPEFAESPFWEKYNNTNDVECTVCYEPLVDGTQTCLNANCAHGFHCRCIRPWLERNNTCPSCRAPFVLLPLGELQQRALQNSFGFSKNKNNKKKNKVLLLKGWVVGIQNLEEWREQCIKTIIDLINKNKINIIAWDGDLLQEDSFTSIIPTLLVKKKKLKVIIFKKKSSVYKLLTPGFSETDEYGNFMQNFNFKNINFKVIAIDESKILNEKGKTDFVKLGLEGYKYIKKYLNNKIIVARMGLGYIAKKEFEAVENNENKEYPKITIIDIPTVRKMNDKIETFGVVNNVNNTNSFGFSKLGIKQLNAFERYLSRI